jgi:hypothetical protein
MCEGNMRIKYRDMNFRKTTLEVIEQANKIVGEYSAQGFDLTLRQLYYQFVARGLLANTDRNYKRLGSIVSDGRVAGLISWEAISDRTRPLYGTNHWDDPGEMVREQAEEYAIDKWEPQEHRVEVWVEKDALRQVVGQASNELDLDYFSCRGYVSQSAMWRAAQRLYRYERQGQIPIVLHLGDHDPSGIDMTRDIQDRLSLFGCMRTEVRRIALTMDQILDQNPPPNPAKTTDSRFRSYVSEYGEDSWELDALEPQFIVDLITEHTFEFRDVDRWAEMADREQRHKELLERACGEMDAWIEQDLEDAND